MNFESTIAIQNKCIEEIKKLQSIEVDPIYLLKKPVIDKKIDYVYDEAFVIFKPGYKIIFLNFGNNDKKFNEFKEDFLYDIGYIVKKYGFLETLGRPREWEKDLICVEQYDEKNYGIANIFGRNKIIDKMQKRKIDMLISLATGSINEAERLGTEVPNNILDQIKRKIILFDGEQTKFIFDELNKKRIVIQGLAGTGKTELLLHKIKELYIDDANNKIVFTCHNQILANNLYKRVPSFFDFMKVEEQIQWCKRLWVMRSWGSSDDKNSGIYSYICYYYKIPFQSFSYSNSFDLICKEALAILNKIDNFIPCFDYILIDESQDFSESFFQLCEKITSKSVYIAGDIFQNIFEETTLSVVTPDFLLNRCYRTDSRTLMSAHAIAMGLFEKKLRWLEDNEWEACGYKIERKKDILELHRKPLKRFEDIDMSKSDAVTLRLSENSDYLNTILLIIDEIRMNNPTVLPEDIAIIFMENIESNFNLAANLDSIINEKYNWKVNLGYITKEKKNGELFISNKNNVKGLEFPFVICVMQNALSNDFTTRNSIYMMLTRSFITSFLIMPNDAINFNVLKSGIDFVNRNGYLKIIEPNDDEKLKLKNTIIKSNNLHVSLHDMSNKIMDELKIDDEKKRFKIMNMAKTMFSKNFDREKLYEFILTNSSMMESL